MNLKKACDETRLYDNSVDMSVKVMPISQIRQVNRRYRLMENNRFRGVTRLMERIFQNYPGNIAVRLWTGDTLTFGNDKADVILVFHDPRLIRNLILFRDPLLLAEAYFQGRFDIVGDIYTVLGLKDHLRSVQLSFVEKIKAVFTALQLGRPFITHELPASENKRPGWLPLSRNHSKNGNRKAVSYHYDVSNEFYQLWLDEQMVYSCAYFEKEQEGLDQAQCNKLEHICRKLHLQPGDRLLDIGCGWGALLRWAVKHHGVRAHGVTLSREQYEYNIEKIKVEGLQDRVTVELKDYRDLNGEAEFDKIVSVGMFEHVGLKNLPQYFGVAQRLLKPGGLFLNHGITHDADGWKNSMGTRFINRYVFPDGELDRVSNIQRVMEQRGFELLDVEALRPHYALTLRHWVRKLESNQYRALQLVPESIYRVWRLYMAACAVQFENGEVGIYQILAVKRDNGLAAVPLTRRSLYR